MFMTRKTRADLQREVTDLQIQVSDHGRLMSGEHDKYRTLHRLARQILVDIVDERPLASTALLLQTAVKVLEEE